MNAKRLLFCFSALIVGIATAIESNVGFSQAIAADDSSIQATTESPDANFQAGDRRVLTINGVEYPFRYCPPGSFEMGNPESGENGDDNETLHPVELTRGFWLLETEVTQEMYQSVMGKNPSAFSPQGNSRRAVEGTATERFPVENVSWEDLRDFFRIINDAASEKLDGETLALPTEAQWEYACRAGSRTAFYFGDRLNGDLANCDGTKPFGTDVAGPALNRTVEVGGYPPNAWGLFDMHGNVAEWNGDWYDNAYYKISPVQDPPGYKRGSSKVNRGGSWLDSAANCRSVLRNWNAPGYRDSNLGFRIALIQKVDPLPAK